MGPAAPASARGRALAAPLAALSARLSRAPGLAAVREEIDALAAGACDRMRVAVVGRVSAGKSTLVNGLLGGYRAPTGRTAVTSAVTWIRHGSPPSVIVHYRGGRAPELRGITDLAALAAAPVTGGSLDGPDQVEYLQVTDEAPYLRQFDLVDTPGLDSTLGVDSSGTLHFLDGPVDALVMVFAKGLHASEVQLMTDFQPGAVAASPINSVAVLTKVEHYWPEAADPMAEAERVARRTAEFAAVSRTAHRLLPVCGLLAAGAANLSGAELADLTELATIPADRLERLLRNAGRFDAADLPVAPERRSLLRDGLSAYGVALACELIREGLDDLAALRAELDRRSGMAEVRALLVDHFGRRAELVKLNRVYGRVQALPAVHGGHLDPRDRAGLADAVRDFCGQAAGQSHAVRELGVLRDHYAGRLTLTAADTEELLRVLGERGADLAARLGQPAGARPEELLAVLGRRLLLWRGVDAAAPYSGPTRTAVSLLVRCYERMLASLQELGGAEEPR